MKLRIIQKAACVLEMSLTCHCLDVREEQLCESASAKLRSRGEIGNGHDQMSCALHLSRGNVEHAEHG